MFLFYLNTVNFSLVLIHILTNVFANTFSKRYTATNLIPSETSNTTNKIKILLKNIYLILNFVKKAFIYFVTFLAFLEKIILGYSEREYLIISQWIWPKLPQNTLETMEFAISAQFRVQTGCRSYKMDIIFDNFSMNLTKMTSKYVQNHGICCFCTV